MPLKERIIRASHEVEKSLMFSTAIMVCAFLPLFTMSGPEEQIFGPMAQTYAFALGGALLLAVTLAPVLCLLLFKHLKPARDNFMVRFLKTGYLRNLRFCLRHRWATLGVMIGLIAGTAALLPFLGREFLPALEEGNVYVRGTFPVDVSLEEVSVEGTHRDESDARAFDEAEMWWPCKSGRVDDGTDPSGYFNTEYHVPLKPQENWPANVKPRGTRTADYAARGGRFFLLKWWYGLLDGLERLVYGPTRSRTKDELIDDMKVELSRYVPGVDWGFSQYIRDNVTEVLSGVKGDNSLKIFGPDLDELERLAVQSKTLLETVPGIKDVGIFRIKGQPNLEIRDDPLKCNRYGVSTADVQAVIRGPSEGRRSRPWSRARRTFDITLQLPSAPCAAVRPRSGTCPWTSRTTRRPQRWCRSGARPSAAAAASACRRSSSTAGLPTPVGKPVRRLVQQPGRHAAAHRWRRSSRRWTIRAGPTRAARWSAPGPRQSAANRASA